MSSDAAPAAPAAPAAKKKNNSKRKASRSEGSKILKARLGEHGAIKYKGIKDKKLRSRLKRNEQLVREAVLGAVKTHEWLLPAEAGVLEAEGLERTWQFKQRDLVQAVETGAAAKVFDLRLTELGPYVTHFTRNGRYMLLGGHKGHLAIMDWQKAHLTCEVQVREATHAVQFLHNEQFFAAAQKKYVYIYDKRGLEVHCLREHTGVRALEFLPHHFLLSSVGEQGVLRYQDTSHGQIVAQHRTRLGPCHTMTQNPWNAVVCLGHANGTVTMWTPNITTPVVKMLCHMGPVSVVMVDATGMHMVTAGVDKQVKVWDVRMMRPRHAYYTHAPVTAMALSHRGMLALAHGHRIQIWKDALMDKQPSPYMNHSLLEGTAASLSFCPYEDVLAVGHSGGLSTVLVPGSGEPNYDSWVADPFQRKKARREAEVHQLLDKLRPETIVLDPDSIGKVRSEPLEVQKERARLAAEANRAARKKQQEKNEAKTKMKGKNKASKSHRKKRSNIIEEKRPEVQKRIQQEQQQEAAAQASKEPAVNLDEVPRALHRFVKK